MTICLSLTTHNRRQKLRDIHTQPPPADPQVVPRAKRFPKQDQASSANSTPTSPTASARLSETSLELSVLFSQKLYHAGEPMSSINARLTKT